MALFCALNDDFKDNAKDIMAELDFAITGLISDEPINPDSPYRTLIAYERVVSYSKNCYLIRH